MPAPSLIDRAHNRTARELKDRCPHNYRLVWVVDFPHPDRRLAECRICLEHRALARGEWINEQGEIELLGKLSCSPS